MLESKKVPSSLVDLCVQKWINNVWLLGDVSETDEYLLDQMLSLCNVDQLRHVENSTKGRDLNPVTDKLWKQLYEKRFGKFNTKEVAERMRKNQVSLKWMQLYEDKVKEIQALELMMRLSLYEDENAYCGPPGCKVSHSETDEEINSLTSQEDEEDDDNDDEEEEEEPCVEEVEEEEDDEDEDDADEDEDEDEDEDADADSNSNDDNYEDGGDDDCGCDCDDYGYDDVDYGYDDGDYGCDDYDDYDEF